MRHSAQACSRITLSYGRLTWLLSPTNRTWRDKGKNKINLPPHHFVGLRSALYCLHVSHEKTTFSVRKPWITEVKYGCPPLRDPDELYPCEAGLEEHRGTSHELDHVQNVFLFQGFNLLFKLCTATGLAEAQPIYLSTTKLLSVALGCQGGRLISFWEWSTSGCTMLLTEFRFQMWHKDLVRASAARGIPGTLPSASGAGWDSLAA